MDRVFEVSAADWRGLGTVPASGLSIRPEFARFDAARLFDVEPGPTREHKGCLLRRRAARHDAPARVPAL